MQQAKMENKKNNSHQFSAAFKSWEYKQIVQTSHNLIG